MIYGPCKMCPGRRYSNAATITPCCVKEICDRCLCTYLISFQANNLPLTCPFKLGNHFIEEIIEERPHDPGRNFSRLKNIYQSIVTG